MARPTMSVASGRTPRCLEAGPAGAGGFTAKMVSPMPFSHSQIWFAHLKFWILFSLHVFLHYSSGQLWFYLLPPSPGQVAQSVRTSSRYAKVGDSIPGQGTYEKQPMNA